MEKSRIAEEELRKKLSSLATTVAPKKKISKTEAPVEPPPTPTELAELIEASSEEKEVKPEVKPPFNSTKYVTLNGYFRVSEGVYAILKRNITRGVNTLLLGPTGVN